MEKGQTGILILVGILVLVGVASGAYFLGKSSKVEPVKVVSTTQPTPSPAEVAVEEKEEISNWKVYTNDTYKYSLKVPNDWVIDFNNAKQNNDGLVFIYSGDFTVVGDTQVPHLSKGSQLEILSNFAVKSYTDLITFDRPDKKEYPNEGKEIIIDGEQAMVWTSDNAFSIPGQKSYQLDVFHSGQGYAIHMVSALPQDVLFNQILSTFRFTK